ncbi:hypothetical protein [Shewanella scandinavica]|uniref:hypothetical protein n=1 Tax=Shewanella scandinavica TaxID=3063538 RepID=UPI00318643CD
MKCAIFVSGPIRYCDEVILQIRSLFEKYSDNITFEFFIHLWISDDSNKARRDESSIQDVLNLLPNIRSLTFEQPLNSVNLNSKYGSWTDTHSDFSSIVGMFVAINKLISVLKKQDDYEEYTHILRLRTDCCFLIKDGLLDNIDFKSNKVYLADNPLISNEWVSDHIMFTKKEKFFSVWEYKSLSKFIKTFSKHARNPEFYLKTKIPKNDRVLKWKRYLDYHIVYRPNKNTDPVVLNNILDAHGVKYLFDYSLNKFQFSELLNYIKEIEAKYANHYSFKNKLIRMMKIILNNKKAY